jgi:hypothetical protein
VDRPKFLDVNLQEPGTEDHARVERMLEALRTPEAVRLARADLARRDLTPVRSILPRGDSWEPEPDEDGDVPPPTQGG